MKRKAQGLAEFAIVAAVVSVIALTVAGPMTEPIKQMFSGMFSSSHSDQNVENQVDTAFKDTHAFLNQAFDEIKSSIVEIQNKLYPFEQDPEQKINITETAGSLADLVKKIAALQDGPEKDALIEQLKEIMNKIGANETLITACTSNPSSCESKIEKQLETHETDTVSNAMWNIENDLEYFSNELIYSKSKTLLKQKELYETQTTLYSQKTDDMLESTNLSYEDFHKELEDTYNQMAIINDGYEYVKDNLPGAAIASCEAANKMYCAANYLYSEGVGMLKNQALDNLNNAATLYQEATTTTTTSTTPIIAPAPMIMNPTYGGGNQGLDVIDSKYPTEEEKQAQIDLLNNDIQQIEDTVYQMETQSSQKTTKLNNLTIMYSDISSSDSKYAN